MPRAQHCLRTFGDNNRGPKICLDNDEDCQLHDDDNEAYINAHLINTLMWFEELKIASNETFKILYTLSSFYNLHISHEDFTLGALNIRRVDIIPINACSSNEVPLDILQRQCKYIFATG